MSPPKHKPTENPLQMQRMVVLAIVASLLFGLFVLPRMGPRPTRVGTVAADFSLLVVAGGNGVDRISLSAQRGQVTILDFWATWCGPCAEQAQILEQYVARGRADVRILAVNEGESDETVRQHLAKRKASYPVVVDSDESVGRSYSVRGLPTLVIVDKDGRIASMVSGVVPYARLERLVAEAAGGR
jgi:thiol-disulfide isomerase/thioredoxin